MAQIHDFTRAKPRTPQNLIGEPDFGRSQANGQVRIDLTYEDMDAWRNVVVFGSGARYAYAPDPEVTPPVEPMAAPPADAPSPIVWHRRPDRLVSAVRLTLIAMAIVFGLARLDAWLS